MCGLSTENIFFKFQAGFSSDISNMLMLSVNAHLRNRLEQKKLEKLHFTCSFNLVNVTKGFLSLLPIYTYKKLSISL